MGYLDLKRLFESAIRVDESWDKGYFEYARCEQRFGYAGRIVLNSSASLSSGTSTSSTRMPRGVKLSLRTIKGRMHPGWLTGEWGFE